MAAADYVDCEPGTGRYRLTEDQAAVLAVYGVPRLLEVFKTGGDLPYAEIGDEVNGAIERLFRPGDRHRLSQDWFAAVPGLADRLTAGAQVADVGCGGGQSTVRMGEAFSNSVILGVDNDEKSLRRARALAASKGLTNVQFLQIPAERILRDRKFDLVCAFDSFHGMVDPKRVLEAIRASLADDGVFLWAEIGENRARALAREAGFSRFERAAIEDPFKQFFLLEK
jgi:2-polyprenyl-3-methyl-5-hydroxy-6-metoxy-1,4-benzoquinol methylase